jgi:predicted RNA-binding protein Jag
MRSELHGEVKAFVEQVVEAMGLAVAVEVSDLEDGSVRVDVQGEESELLLRRKGEGLDALQHLVNSAYRRDVGRDQRIVIDAMTKLGDPTFQFHYLTRSCFATPNV